MKKIFKKILDALPFNGSKTKISIFVAILGVFRMIFPGSSEIINLIEQIIKSPEGMTLIGAIGSVISVYHKKLKRESGEK